MVLLDQDKLITLYLIHLPYHVFCFAVTLVLSPVSDATIVQPYSIVRTHLSTWLMSSLYNE